MKTVTIYGASDDLIELEGDLHDEISHMDSSELGYLAFSDGTVLSIVYDKEGCWRIHRISLSNEGSSTYSKVEAKGSDTDEYSDRVTLTGENLTWCIAGAYLVKSKLPPERT